MTSTSGGTGVLAASSKTCVGQRGQPGCSATIEAFCTACGQVAFSPDGSAVALVQGDTLYLSRHHGDDWSAPSALYGGKGAKGAVTHVVWSPDGAFVAVAVQPAATPSSTAPRVVDEAVIVDIITNAAPAVPQLLCTLPVAAGGNNSRASQSGAGAGAAAGAATCFDNSTLGGSLSMPAWTVSCWPFDSQFDVSPDGKHVAYTYLPEPYANDWVGVGVGVLDLATSKVVAVGGNTTFQPYFSPDGDKLAFVTADPLPYTWSQVWSICVVSGVGSLRGGAGAGGLTAPRCSTNTSDQMPTLAGWDDAGRILYTEQASVAINLYAIDGATLSGWEQIELKGAAVPAAGGPTVIGGAFRATSRVSIARAAKGAASAGQPTTAIGLTVEGPSSPQQGYTGVVAGAVAQTTQVTVGVNSAAAAHTFPKFTTIKWPSTDGKVIEGILLLPPGFDPKQPKAAPLAVFTHCGPAMAVTATHLGYGSVCARFPLAQLAEAGYLVLQPNYRGSTGYGRDFRMSDQGDWGGNDYNDVFSGAAHLIKLGHVAPVCHHHHHHHHTTTPHHTGCLSFRRFFFALHLLAAHRICVC